ncbi:NUDIX domain-containing protein [Planctomicrobium sp. SH664]|uniref:NUDIX domain-containing protein n=1 Tax=Planctomicrobium sp. SH664 TaxID=3448125 RepID=UPI003F5B74BF
MPAGKLSAGLMMYRQPRGLLEVLLVHPGGPFFQKKDLGAWTIPKGEPAEDETLLAAAQREFQEETGFLPVPPFLELGHVVQKGGKHVHAWAFSGDCDPHTLRSNEVTLEWPTRSGRQLTFPEVDRADFFDVVTARTKINPAQAELLDRLQGLLTEEST